MGTGVLRHWWLRPLSAAMWAVQPRERLPYRIVWALVRERWGISQIKPDTTRETP